MLYNYFKIAIRNLIKHKSFSFINILGLALAMSACMAIIMLVSDQMELDRFNTGANRIYRINTLPTFYDNGNTFPGTETATTTLPLSEELKLNHTGIENSVRLMRGFGNAWLELEPNYDVNIPVSGFYADPEVFDLFQYELEFGDPQQALQAPYSVVITKATARKLFKVENPVGEIIKVGKLGNYTVTGVLKDNGNRSHILADAFASISTVESLTKQGVFGNDLQKWNNFTMGWVYVKLDENTNELALQEKLKKVSSEHPNTNKENGVDIHYTTQALLDIVPGKMVNNPIGPFMPWIIIYFLAGIAGIILITSCFNFTNLSIARALTRAKEIGVRKTSGAIRWQLFVQFISESIVIALVAFVLALGILHFVKPFIQDLAFARFLKWNLTANVYVYVIFAAFTLLVGIIAGFFPAVVLSGFKPIQVLKNLHQNKLMSKVGMRKALLVVQFALSAIFILTVLVLYNQLNLLMQNDNGFSTENKIILQKGVADLQILKTELSKQAEFEQVSLASHLPMTGITFGENYRKDENNQEFTFLHTYSVDENYLANMDLKLLTGRFFNAEDAGKNNSIIINEEAIKQYHLVDQHEAIGKSLIRQEDSTALTVIGVVKNYHHEMMAEKLNAMGLVYDTSRFAIVQAKHVGNFTQAKEKASATWKNIFPGTVVEVKSFKEQLGQMYEIIFGTMFKVLGFLAFFAVLISCLGLLGMATYTIETRRKEIAIRKVLGSSSASLIYTLSKGYLIIIAVALLIAVPVAYFMNTLWLENLAVHVTVDIFTISLGIVLLTSFAILTIGSQTLQALRLNPVDNLKSE
ncbi:MAG: ABC transporter permease [Cyclobacteriaceae bacterium]|jgi:putative ABC transport system permease protein|nr:ABC transporter permease [Cyclobacteriaceae bacterium]